MSVLGRTNQSFPPVWLSLMEPHEPSSGWVDALVQSALEAHTVLDISVRTALWGSALRGTDATLMAVAGRDVADAPTADVASHLIHAKLVSLLSSIGRDHIDFFFLDYRSAWEEAQLNGALEALETARQDGIVRFVGLAAFGSDLAALGMWQFHDAFDVVMMPRNPVQKDAYTSLEPLARERRVGVVTTGCLDWGHGVPFVDLPAPWRLRNLAQSFSGRSAAQLSVGRFASDHPVVVGVRSPGEVAQAVQATEGSLPTGIDVWLEEFAEAYRDSETWEALRQDSRLWVAKRAAGVPR